MYRGGQPGHFWPKLAGWFLVPGAAAVATRLLSGLVVKGTDTPEEQAKTVVTLSAVCHALGAAGSWYVSGHMFEDSAGTQAFFRGGMWSELVSTAFVGSSSIVSQQLPAAPAAPAIKGLDPRSHMEHMLSLLTGGITQKLAASQAHPQFAR